MRRQRSRELVCSWGHISVLRDGKIATQVARSPKNRGFSLFFATIRALAAAGFLPQCEVADHHGSVGALAHVIDRQRRH